MTKIMNARTTTPFTRWTSVTNADCHSNPSEDRFDIVGAWTPAPLVEEEWLGPVAKNPVAHRAVGAQALCGRERDREQPELAILRSCDCQYPLVEVDIGLIERQRLPEPEPRDRNQSEEGREGPRVQPAW